MCLNEIQSDLKYLFTSQQHVTKRAVIALSAAELRLELKLWF